MARFSARREAAIAAHRLDITLGSEHRGSTVITDIPRTDRPKDTTDAKRDAGTFPKQVAEHSPLVSSDIRAYEGNPRVGQYRRALSRTV